MFIGAQVSLVKIRIHLLEKIAFGEFLENVNSDVVRESVQLIWSETGE